MSKADFEQRLNKYREFGATALALTLGAIVTLGLVGADTVWCLLHANKELSHHFRKRTKKGGKR